MKMTKFDKPVKVYGTRKAGMTTVLALIALTEEVKGKKK